MAQIIFFSIVFSVYGLINYYVGSRILSLIPQQFRTLSLVIFLFLVLSYIAGRLLESYDMPFISTSLIWIGSFWLAIMFYSFLSILLIDIIRLFNYLFGIFPDIIMDNYDKVRNFTAIVLAAVIIITVFAGHINTRILTVKSVELNISKTVKDLDVLNIVLISDIHLGIVINNSYLQKIIDSTNSLNPDLILLAGDTIDEDIKPVIRNDAGKMLRQFRARYGVYGITGNHEYIGGVEPSVQYLIDHDIKLLRDEYELIDNKFYLVGREDRAISQFTTNNRKPLDEIMEGVDNSLPVILMDHQPFGLNDALEQGVDLQVSGHTHNGQLWPMNYIIDMVYELGWGYLQKENTHYYVSCGAGLWGPPVRTGSRPEIINIRLRFNQN
ncbi:MAG: metallophosphoesterase [Melioribacteraceae bacterium]|nr:metallophosphoesterase [Melioribacteraceae bacterium]